MTPSSSQPIRLMIADDHQLFLSGIRGLLEKSDEIDVTDEANNGRELLKLVDLRPPDVVLLDLSMPVMDGRETCRVLKANHPQVKVLILTMHNDAKTITELLEAGADGYLLKEASKRELLNAIQTVMTTGQYFSQAVSEAFISRFRQKQKTASESTLSITSREREVLDLIIKEFTAQEIADQLFVGINTVITHRKNLLRKFGVRNTAGLVREAVRQGFGE